LFAFPYLSIVIFNLIKDLNYVIQSFQDVQFTITSNNIIYQLTSSFTNI
jgi:hypothetical protein